MTARIASLPMYDWPEVQAENDAAWSRARDRLRAQGIEAPERLTRGGAALDALWRDPNLFLSQTCWGPMEAGLAPHVQVVAQPDYSACEGGTGEFYSSAVVMRAASGARPGAALELERLRNARFAFNSADSRSGYLALKADLEARGEGLSIFSALVETGGHRASIRAVAEGVADVAAIDCKAWALARRHEPAAQALAAVGWTAPRKGLPFITARATPAPVVAALREALRVAGLA